MASSLAVFYLKEYFLTKLEQTYLSVPLGKNNRKPWTLHIKQTQLLKGREKTDQAGSLGTPRSTCSVGLYFHFIYSKLNHATWKQQQTQKGKVCFL
jgi:hypothetical protein